VVIPGLVHGYDGGSEADLLCLWISVPLLLEGGCVHVTAWVGSKRYGVRIVYRDVADGPRGQ